MEDVDGPRARSEETAAREEARLWHRYWEAAQNPASKGMLDAACEALLIYYAPRAARLLSNMLSRGVLGAAVLRQQDRDDLQQEAMLAVYRCFAKYEPNRGKFWPFVKMSVWEAIYDANLDRQGLNYDQVKRLQEIRRAEERAEQRLGRRPSNAEVAAEAHLSEEQVFKALALRGERDAIVLSSPVSAFPDGDEGETVGATIPDASLTVEEEVGTKVEQELLQTALSELESNNDAMLLILSYWFDWTAPQLAEFLRSPGTQKLALAEHEIWQKTNLLEFLNSIVPESVKVDAMRQRLARARGKLRDKLLTLDPDYRPAGLRAPPPPHRDRKRSDTSRLPGASEGKDDSYAAR